MKIDKKRYFELLNEAKKDPNSAGVLVSKKRYSGVEAASMEYVSTILKNGEKVALATKKEDQDYIDKWVNVMKDSYGLNVQYKKLYSTKLAEYGFCENRNEFIGYELFCS